MGREGQPLPARDCDHVPSRRIVDFESGTVIVGESLVDIRSRTKQQDKASRCRLHS